MDGLLFYSISAAVALAVAVKSFRICVSRQSDVYRHEPKSRQFPPESQALLLPL